MILVKAQKKNQIPNYSKSCDKYYKAWFVKNLTPEKLVLKTFNLEDFIYLCVYMYAFYMCT